MRASLFLQNFLLSGVCFLASTITWATEAVLTGQGRVLASPDYVEVVIQVESKCYNKPAEARQANDEAARKVVDFLNEKLKQNNHNNKYYNKVISLGGYTTSYQTYYQDKILCQNTFQKHNNITFRTQEIANFEVLFDEIQNQVYALFNTQSRDVITNSMTYVTLSSPMPNISDERRAKLEQESMSLALGDAKNKLIALFGVDKIQHLKVIQVSELPPNASGPVFHRANNHAAVGQMAMKSLRADVAGPAPVQFDTEWISKMLYFTFGFDELVLDIRQ